MFKLTNKKVLITGGCSGIGQSIALTFLAQGAEVHVLDLKPSVEHMPTEITFHQADITSLEAVEAIAAELKSIDILVNNAGIDPRKTWNEITVADWDHVMATNVRSQFICAKAVFPLMKQQDYGKIINVSSVVFLTGQKGYVHYVTSKGAIIGFTRALANEIGMHHINVNAIILGAIHTENELEKLGSLEAQEKATNMLMDIQAIPQRIQTSDIEGTFLFLASADSDLITGQSMNIDGGWMMH